MNYLLEALSRKRCTPELVERIGSVFQIYEQDFLSPQSLWYQRNPRKRTPSAPVLIDETEPDIETLQEMQEMLTSEYRKEEVVRYMNSCLGESGVCYSKDLHIRDDKAYIMSLLGVAMEGEQGTNYTVEELGGSYVENGYQIPQLRITRKEERK